MYLSHCILWLRYIDDIHMLCKGQLRPCEGQLLLFHDELNVNDRNIRLTFNYHSETLSFLDLQISVMGNKLIMKTFHKETAASHRPDRKSPPLLSGTQGSS